MATKNVLNIVQLHICLLYSTKNLVLQYSVLIWIPGQDWIYSAISYTYILCEGMYPKGWYIIIEKEMIEFELLKQLLIILCIVMRCFSWVQFPWTRKVPQSHRAALSDSEHSSQAPTRETPFVGSGWWWCLAVDLILDNALKVKCALIYFDVIRAS